MGRTRTLPTDQSTSRTATPAAQRFVPLAYRIDDAAAIIGVSKSTVWRLIHEGRLPARKLDSSTIIRHDDLTAFIDGLPMVRQLAEPSTTPLPEPPPPVPRAVPAPPAPLRPPAPPVDLRREPPQPRFLQPQSPPAPALPDKQAPYGRGRMGKPLSPPNPNGWGARTLRRPSEQLAAIVGADPISRPKALEAIWKHIHANGLQRPGDLRIIYADDKLRAVAGTDVITMYALEELIRPHLGVIT
ncbi:SWIB/MDM2 domain-containing protein [Lichenibacterium dinghuense]|uniref:SWIB/MDM2 domain-containing protein n=1 Tax=Lichenibacterium dinghuense TaxID=2895977 RepID=UPI001F274711|nr:SWIB/MDM2 domain-containing protein [Lichenibacterium sp. 6Y81]